MILPRILVMSTLNVLPILSNAANVDGAARVELEGVAARALMVAYATYREQLPEARIEGYTVLVGPVRDGKVEVVFVPKQADPKRPVLGGRTSAGREFHVWVSVDHYAVDKTSFAR
jgi:hypothetical protein